MLEFTGIVHVVAETKSYGAKGFLKRQLVVKEAKENDKYPNLVPFTLTGDRTSLADDLHEGDKVKCSFVLSGRGWDKGDGSPIRYFCDNVVLKLEILETAGGGSRPSNVPPPAEPPADAGADETIDDIPF